MYNDSFYPTPAEVAARMLARLDPKRLRGATILEPSAGKGDLADAAVKALAELSAIGREGQRFRERVHCIETDVELQATLRGKGYPLVGSDFLRFRPDEKYDLILMNPPFAGAEKHLLHAWDILGHGDILCLVSEQTILNPCTAFRRQLATLIEDHGSVEHLGACFQDAFRKSEARVCLIHLTKARQEPEFAFLTADGMERDPYAAFTDAGRFASEVATRDLIGNLVANFDRCRELFLQVARLTQELGHYAKVFEASHGYSGETLSSLLGRELECLMRGQHTREAQERAYNQFVKGLKQNAWCEVFRLTDLRNLVSANVSKEMTRLIDDNARMAFSADNIAAMLETLFFNRGAILKQCVTEAFDLMTKYYEENRVYMEGWKTNDAWRVNQRVVLPNIVDADWPGSPRIKWEQERKLNDIDRALAFLDGKKLDEVPLTMANAIQQCFKTHKDEFSGVLLKSSHFEMRCYKKGTLHLKFLDRALWERFNLTAAEGKNWLPDDVKAREKRADQCGLPLNA